MSSEDVTATYEALEKARGAVMKAKDVHEEAFSDLEDPMGGVAALSSEIECGPGADGDELDQADLHITMSELQEHIAECLGALERLEAARQAYLKALEKESEAATAFEQAISRLESSLPPF